MGRHAQAPAPAPRDPVFLAVEHEHVRHVNRDIFSVSFASDCVAHECRCRNEDDRVRLDACCQYGADVLIPEKGAILRRAREIASVLQPQHRAPETWFDERDPGIDPLAPEGLIIRTATADPNRETSGCVFLQNTGERGCGLHRAALEHDFDPAEIKPSVCRLYPLSFDAGRLGLSEDFYDYSCATSGSESVYRVMRPTLEEMFGSASVAALDLLERSARGRRLKVLAR